MKDPEGSLVFLLFHLLPECHGSGGVAGGRHGIYFFYFLELASGQLQGRAEDTLGMDRRQGRASTWACGERWMGEAVPREGAEGARDCGELRRVRQL